MKIGLFETFPGFGGGNTYQKYIIQALEKEHDVHFFRVDAHPLLGFRLGKLYYSYKIFSSHPEIDLWISSYIATTALSLGRSHNKTISLFYHIDDNILPNKMLGRILWKLFLSQAPKCYRVVCIAKYWRDFLRNKGLKNIDIIYWGFDVSRFHFSQDDIFSFREKHKLMDKPVIYLGNCQERKGVVDAYNQLRDLDFHLVTSGVEEVKIPARNLCLDYKEYRLLLASSDLVLTLSKFTEGWNGTAHEALLAGTPVIGSGLGGMQELLEQAEQPVCKNINDLPKLVTYAINNKRALSEKGRRFAEQFTMERFNNAWLALVNNFAEEIQ